jgi:ketosteroid isomerase-like protein
MTISTQTTSTSERIVAAMRDADWEAITSSYAPNVLLDMNLPMWRFQVQGREAASAYLHEEVRNFANLRTTQHTAYRCGDDVLIVEEEMRFDAPDGGGGECLWRAVDVFRLDGELIAEHKQYCTGTWSPEVIARQAAEAPMVRW